LASVERGQSILSVENKRREGKEMAQSPILLAGATGEVGFRVLQKLKAAGRVVHTLSANAQRASALVPLGLADRVFAGDATDASNLKGVAEGVETILSCLGANVSLRPRERRSFFDVDTVAHLNLIKEAKASGVRRFVYLSAHVQPAYEKTAYIQAHERVVEALESSGMSTTILRPTGIFTALDDFLRMARWGLAFSMGSGMARTNPIHPMDVAEKMVSVVDEGEPSIDFGGEEIMTRYQIIEKAFEAVGRKPRILRMPLSLLRFNASMLGLFHRRLGEMMRFAIEVSAEDAIAPAFGKHTLLDYYRERLREMTHAS
jgi:uncharacterized protein YbjT (DUF2867 family)